MSGTIYFAELPDRQRIKIGFSENPTQRFESLRRSFPGLHLLGWMPGSQTLEKTFHAGFNEERLPKDSSGTEWFTPSPRLRAFIDACAQHHAFPMMPEAPDDALAVVSLRIDPNIHQQVKLFAAEHATTIYSVYSNALEKYLKSKEAQ